MGPFARSVAVAAGLVACAVVYAASLADRASRALAAGALAGALATLFLALSRDVGDVAVGAAIAVGVARSGFLTRRRPLRAIALEALLLAGGLAAARAFFSPGLAGVALALWGFFLVQSLAPLVGGASPRRAAPEGVDPFEHARARAEALLDEPAPRAPTP
jgi:hypothetical protein